MFIRELARNTLASAIHRLRTVKVGHRVTDSRFATWICGEGAVVARLRYGAEAVVFVDDYVGRAMFLWGDDDPRISAVIDTILRKGDTVIDIGANFGVVGLLVAKRVGETGVVHLFEPQPAVASCLRTSLMMNGYSNGVVHECALSASTGSAEMTIVDPSNRGMTTLSPSDTESSNSSQRIQVRMECAGEYVASLGCNRVALIKIDAEGHEAIILASMKGWLAEICPPVILFECHIDARGFQEQESIRILTSLGYEILGYDYKPLWSTRLLKLAGEQHPPGRDFIAVLWDELDQDRRDSLEAMIVVPRGR